MGTWNIPDQKGTHTSAKSPCHLLRLPQQPLCLGFPHREVTDHLADGTN